MGHPPSHNGSPPPLRSGPAAPANPLPISGEPPHLPHRPVPRCCCGVLGLLLFTAVTCLTLLHASVNVANSSIRSIKVVMDDNYPPYTFKGSNGQLKGILPDQWRLWEQRTGMVVELSAMEWAEAQRRMQAGEFDVIDTIFRNQQREQIYDFSKPYVNLDVPLYFRSDISGISSVDDVKDFAVGVKAGGNIVNVLKARGVNNLIPFKSYEDIVAAARDRKINVFVMERIPANYFLYKYDLYDKFRETAPIYTGQFHRAVHKGNQDLLHTVENGFSSIPKGDYETIEKRWYGVPLLSPGLKRHLVLSGSLAFVVFSGLFLWLWMLRRLVAQRTADLSNSIRELDRQKKLTAYVINGTTDAIFAKDAAGRYLLVNREVERVFNLPADQIVGRDDTAFFPPAEAEALMASDRRIMAMETPFTQEEELTTIDGCRVYQATKGPIRDDQGEVIGLFGVSRDITERKRSERMLKHRLDLLTSPDSATQISFTDLFDLQEIQKIQDAFAMATGVASIITDTSGNPITKPSNCSDLCINIIRRTEKGLANCLRTEAVLGGMKACGAAQQPCPSGGLMDGGAAIHVGGHHVANWLVGQVLDEACDLGTMMAYAREIGANEAEYGKALQQVKRMSSEQFKNVCSALHQIAGQLSGMAMQNLNQAQYIWERKQAEEALHASEKRFRELLENVRLVAVILDVQGTVNFCNDFLARLSGWSTGELIGCDWFDRFIPVPLRQQLRGEFEQGISAGTLQTHGEYPIQTRSGSLRSIVWDTSVLHNPDGSIAGVAHIGLDVTDHRHLEEQLRQSQKMEAVGQLAGGVAHDFNNILQVIIGYGSMTLKTLAPEAPTRMAAERIVSAAEKAAQLTRGLLAFSRRQVMDPQLVSLNEIVRQVQTLLVRIIGEDIQVKTILYQAELPIRVDKGQMEQVLINLATNARDAMPKGGILSIETGQEEIGPSQPSEQVGDYPAPGRYACLTISDTGTGMDEGTRARVFEPFFTTKEVGKGTGLGLAIVYGIVRQHNGFVSIDSQPGHGATFRICLPLVEAVQGRQEECPPPPTPRRGSETILVAEDDMTVRELVVETLQEYGYEVLQAGDGLEAVETFAAHGKKIDLVLMDMIMPRKNGKEAYQEINLIKPGVKVLYVSGYTAEFIQDRGAHEEGVELLLKPVLPSDLLRKVREMLDS